MVAGAVVGISLGVLIVILIIWLVFRKKEKKKYEEEETPNEIRFSHLLFFWDWFTLFFCHFVQFFCSNLLKMLQLCECEWDDECSVAMRVFLHVLSFLYHRDSVALLV